jgi:hypothetical protein
MEQKHLKKGKEVRYQSLENFRPINNDEALEQDQEIAYRDASPAARLRYAIVKKMLNEKTCFVEVGQCKNAIAGRSLEVERVYVRKNGNKSLGNTTDYSSEQIRPLDCYVPDALVLLKLNGQTYQWVKIKQSYPDDQVAILTNKKHGTICHKKDLFLPTNTNIVGEKSEDLDSSL